VFPPAAQTADVPAVAAPAPEVAPAEPVPPETAEAAPTEAAPTEAAPAEAAPAETAPAETAPVEATSTETAPAETAPTESISTEGASAEGAPEGAAAAGEASSEAPPGTPAGPPPVPGLVEEAVPPEAAAPEGPEAPEAAPPPPKPAGPLVDWSNVANPVPADAASVERGRVFYQGQGLCAVCHGNKGDGFGPVWEQFSPPPNAFLDPTWQQQFTDGQLMGVLHDGKFGTGMLAMVPDFMTEAEGWDVINFLRTFSGKTSEAYERAQAAKAKREEERQKKIQGDIP